MNSSSGFLAPKQADLASLATDQERAGIGFKVFLLAVVITSYYYVLPLGRFSFANFLSDFRIYDIAFLFFFLLVVVPNFSEFISQLADKRNFFRPAALLILMCWLSLIVTASTGGENILPAIIRAARFTAYFITGCMVVVLVKDARSYRFILFVIYANIAVQSFLAFAQSRGWLPNFWPDYWLTAFGDYPVGTLSPHHKQIGVVMLLGAGLSLSLLRHAKKAPLAYLIIFPVLALNLIIPIFSASRTAWLGIAALFLAYIYINRAGALGVIILGALGLGVIAWYARDSLQEPIFDKINEVFIYRYETYGIEGVAKERLKIYESYPSAIANSPWILVIGTGFQNISSFLSASGAHNNFAQALFELGLLGFIVYLAMLVKILSTLRQTARQTTFPLGKTVAKDMWAVFVGVLATMLVGESLWAQYSMFTLTGQIITLMALATTPLYWASDQTPEADLDDPLPRRRLF